MSLGVIKPGLNAAMLLLFGYWSRELAMRLNEAVFSKALLESYWGLVIDY